jgi:hypothetical protein
MTREEIFGYIARLDTWLLFLAGEELRASRSHRPGEHLERYREIRAEARHIQKLRLDWFNLMPPPVMLRRPDGRFQL